MTTIKTHKDLDVWKKAMDLAEHVYQVSATIPKEETYGLILQIRKSAISVPSNIAEGAARNSKKEFIQFLYIALGSLAELETQLLLAARMLFIDRDSELLKEVSQIRQILCGLIRSLKPNFPSKDEKINKP